MGTTYHIKVVSHGLNNPSFLHSRIEKRLAQINQSMSTYIKDSEISQFNQSTDIEKKHYVSADFLRVMAISEKLFQLTRGAWDGTVKPLVDLWGFRKPKNEFILPPADRVSATLSRIGFDKIKIVPEDGTLQKSVPDITVDLASVAKGYGVDQIAGLIRENGYTDFLVEIGGEIYASGSTEKGLPWKIGINTPDADSAFDQVYKAVEVRHQAVATSGGYRNFNEIEGKRYSHIIDPRTGYPVENKIVSVTIIAQNCTFADGLATAVTVMGPVDGLDLINRLDRVEGLIIIMDEKGRLADLPSKGFTHSHYSD